jgi:hypothetical protein
MLVSDPSPNRGTAAASATSSPQVAVSQSSCCIRTKDEADLAAIYDASTDLVVLERPAVRAAFSALAERVTNDFLLTLRGRAADLDFGIVLAGDHGPEARALRDDLAHVTRMFSDLFEAEEVGARIVCATRPSCPKVHVDRVMARLTVAYVGPGTRWSRAQRTSPAQLARASSDSPFFDCTEGALPLDVVLMKGAAWPGSAGSGVAHQSPAHADRRLLLTLDLL